MALYVTEKQLFERIIITKYKSSTEDPIFFHIREAKDLNGQVCMEDR
jgi:hypothetical protein